MSWTDSLSTRISSLPLVIAGPILRAVSPTSVSVWVALKSSQTVTLTVFNGGTTLFSGSIATTALGANLHVCVVTATTTTALVPGINYTYNLSFSNGTNLASAGVLNNAGSPSGAIGLVSYGTLGKPSFSLPPTDFNKLRIVHASCRKPHGESLDALEGLDTMISQVISNPSSADMRPHQAFFTGDQIYSDDVADALLFMIMDADTNLISKTETLPGVSSLPGPGLRAGLVRGTGKFTSEADACKSHLMKMHEFFCMYLFAWSPALWPNTLPDFATVLPTVSPTRIAYYGLDGEYTADSLEKTTFDTENTRLTSFKSALPNVRKALANVPCYMMLDDHEITDDWYLNGKWYSDVAGSTLGTRIIANGLAAYAVFQDWGNHPANYVSPQSGNTLLNALAAGNTDSIFSSTIAPLVLPVYNSSTKQLSHASNGLAWNYKVTMPKYEVIVLDSRTMREFPNQVGYPALINATAMNAQLPPLSGGQLTTNELTIVVAPAPVFGVPRVESFQQGLHSQADMVEKDAEAWGLGMREQDTLQYLLAALAQRANSGTTRKGRVLLLSGDVHYGFSIRIEYWATNPLSQSPGNFDVVIAQLTASSLKNETNKFTGTYNVHNHGYYYLTMGASPNNPKKFYGYNALSSPITIGSHMITSYPSMSSYSMNLVAKTGKLVFDKDEELSSINSFGFTSTFSPSATPHWRYRIDYIRDLTGESRLAYSYAKASVSAPPYANRQAALTNYLAHASNAKSYDKEWGNGKEIVGTNNLGDITFDWNANDSLKTVRHTLWWRLRSAVDQKAALAMFPLTQYIIPLGYSIPAYPQP